MSRLTSLAGLLALVGASSAAAQRPDFSGEWMRASDSAAARPAVAATGDAAFRRGDMGSGWGSPLTIRQRSDSLIVEFVVFSAYDLQPPLRFAYALDGSESSNNVMIGHATSVQRSRLTWRDSALVIASAHRVPADVDPRGGTLTVVQTLALESPTTLVVETARGASRIRTVYTKR